MDDETRGMTASHRSNQGANAVARSDFDALQERLLLIERRLESIAAQAATVAVPLPDNTILVQTVWGIKVIIDALDVVMTPQMVVYREWERELSQLFADFAGPDTVFVDVGANLGYFTCLVGSRIGQAGHGRIIAIEPNPHMVARIHRNVEINWSMCPIDVQPVGASDHEGMVELFLPKDHLANATVLVWPDGRDDVIQVPVRTIDEIARNVVSVDLMKIDVEGYERFVLNGARQLIERSPGVRIIMEWSKGQLGMTGTSSEAMTAMFSELGLVACRLPGSLRNFSIADIRIADSDLHYLEYGNILLVHDS